MIIEDSSIAAAPKLSVMVLVYNHDKYLRKCLDSILMQKVDFEYEVVIGEDCSTDNSRDICIEYQKRYPKIFRLILQERNKGLICNYNDTCNLMRGEYEACIAGDDYWIDNNKLQMQVDYLEDNPNVGLCYTNVVTCDGFDKENVKPLIDYSIMPKSFEEQLFKTSYMAPCTWTYRGELRRKICEQKDWFTDDSLATTLDFLHESKMEFIDKITAAYRVHEGSLATQTDPIKKWQYERGIFKMQLFYANKYRCNDDLILKLKTQEYTNKIFVAIEAEDKNFVQEMLLFYRSQGMEMKWFVKSCEQYVIYHRQYARILRSKAYRLGKILLRPFRLLK